MTWPKSFAGNQRPLEQTKPGETALDAVRYVMGEEYIRLLIFADVFGSRFFVTPLPNASIRYNT